MGMYIFLYVWTGKYYIIMICVVANYENGTYFGNRLVMGLAGCAYKAGLVKTLKK